MDIKKKLHRQAKFVLPTAQENDTIKARLRQSCPAPKRQRVNLKKLVWACAAICTCVCIGVGTGVLLDRQGSVNTPTSLSVNTYVRIDINPSIVFTLDGNDNVTAITPHNKDGAVLLYGENLTGLTLDEACDRIISLSWKLGYLQSGGNINVTVAGDNKDKEISIGQNLIGSIDLYLSANSIDAHIVATGDLQTQELAQQYNVTTGRMVLIQKVSETSGMSIDKVAKLSLDELNEWLKNDKSEEVEDTERTLDNFKSDMERDENYQQLKAQIAEYEKLIDCIEDIMDSIGDDEEDEREENKKDEDDEEDEDDDICITNIGDAIVAFNALFEANSPFIYNGAADVKAFELHTKSVVKAMEDYIDYAEDCLEDYWDNLKEQYKNQIAD
ncbi:MAG: hypothetical protein ACI4MI_05785 [Christensenellales bacterium]